MTDLAQPVADARDRVGISTRARAVAKQAAAAAGVSIDVVVTEPEARATIRVLAQVWPQDDGHLPFTPEAAWALAYSGNYVALARRGDTPVGGAIGFRGVDEHGAHLHSHMAGVAEGLRGQSVGHALKLHQRAWALAQGLDRVTWTFDPLVTRNAYFNIIKLGATIERFYPNFYGELSDGINVGDESDRCLVSWDLSSPRAVDAADGAAAPANAATLRSAGATAVLDLDAHGAPQILPGTGPTLLCHLPPDIVKLRESDPALARQWRQALRDVLVPALDRGYQVTSVTRDGWYVLTTLNECDIHSAFQGATGPTSP